MPFSPAKNLQIHNQIERVLHVPGNYRGGILEMAIVIDCDYATDEIRTLCKDLVTCCKSQSEVFRNVRLNIVEWRKDKINTEISSMPYLQMGTWFEKYQPENESSQEDTKKETTEKIIAEKKATEKETAEIGTADKEITEKETAEKKATDKQTAEKETADKETTEKTTKKEAELKKSPEELMSYLKKFHARSKIVFLLTPDADNLKPSAAKEKLIEAMNPFLKQKLIILTPEKIQSGTEFVLSMLLN